MEQASTRRGEIIEPALEFHSPGIGLVGHEDGGGLVALLARRRKSRWTISRWRLRSLSWAPRTRERAAHRSIEG